MKALTMVSHEGNVFWPPIVKFKASCKIMIKYFPYDDQVRPSINDLDPSIALHVVTTNLYAKLGAVLHCVIKRL